MAEASARLPMFHRSGTFEETGVPTNCFRALCDCPRLCMALIWECRPKKRRMQLCGQSPGNVYWPVVFGTSPWMPAVLFLIYRFGFMLVFLYHFNMHYGREGKFLGQFFWIYLTNWSLTVQTVYSVTACITALFAFVKLRRHGHPGFKDFDAVDGQDEPIALPCIVRLNWILFHIAVAAGEMVALLFWTLLKPIWAADKFAGWDPKDVYLVCFVHGYNAVLLLTDLCVSRSVYYLKYVSFFLLYAFVYVAWTVVHHILQIGLHPEKAAECLDEWKKGADRKDLSNCPIYEPINWILWQRTLVLMFVVLCVVVPLCQCPIWTCVHCRRSMDSFVHNWLYPVEVDEATEPQPVQDEMELGASRPTLPNDGERARLSTNSSWLHPVEVEEATQPQPVQDVMELGSSRSALPKEGDRLSATSRATLALQRELTG